MKTLNLFVAIGCILTLPACSIKNTIQNAEKAVFTVYTYDKFGAPSGTETGFFIDNEGTAFTNYHVLDGAVKAYIETIDGHSYEIKDILMSDKNKDIVKFTIHNPDNVDLPNLSLHRGNYEKGDEIIVIGSPLDLTNSVTTGIISALRTDRSHGDIIQISAPISPGNSGSPVLTKNGKVIGIATFNRVGGQNLNFAVATKNVDELSSNDFEKENRKFNLKDDFIILNLPSDNGSDIILNAIEFGKNQTTAYFTYINMNLIYGESMIIWNELHKDDSDYGFCITDQERNRQYYIASSSIGSNKNSGTEVNLCDSYQFQVYFPAIKSKLEKIDIANGTDSRSWKFTDIDLNYYRNNLSVDMNLYRKLYAMSQMKEGELGGAYQIFQDILSEDPTDVECLNGLGLISYVTDNQLDAMSYFNTAIEENPLNVLSYLNRCAIFDAKEDYKSALADITKAIEIDPAQPDYYYHRALTYCKINDYKSALTDMDQLISSNDFKKEAYAYYVRAMIHIEMNDKKAASKDIYTSFQLSDDEELEKELQKMWQYCGN